MKAVVLKYQSRHLLAKNLKTNNMTPMQLYINTLQTQLINMPDGYVRETVQACLNLAQGIKVMYEDTNNNLSNESNQD